MPTKHTILLNKEEARAIDSCCAYFEATPRGGDIEHDGRRDRAIEQAVAEISRAMTTTVPVPRPIRLTHPQMSALCEVLGLGNATCESGDDIAARHLPYIRSAHQRIIEAHNHQR